MTIEESRAMWLARWRENATAAEKLRAQIVATYRRNGGADTPRTRVLWTAVHACNDVARESIECLRDRGGLLLAVPA